MENTKVDATFSEKTKFLGSTYVITFVLWILAAYLAGYLTNELAFVEWINAVANWDIFKLVITFLILGFLGAYLDRQSKSINPILLVIRFVSIVFVMVCVNIRWDIQPEKEYYSFIQKIVLYALVAQLIRFGAMYLFHQMGKTGERLEWIISRIVFFFIIGLIAYGIFTIKDRQAGNETVLAIDQFLIQSLSAPLLTLILMSDYAFSKRSPTARSIAYNIYYVKIDEPLKAASVRIRFLTAVYVFGAGAILTEAILSS